MINKKSMKQAGYQYVGCLTKGCHVLYSPITNRFEKWFCNKNFVYGIKWNNTYLQFVAIPVVTSDLMYLAGKEAKRYYKNKSN